MEPGQQSRNDVTERNVHAPTRLHGSSGDGVGCRDKRAQTPEDASVELTSFMINVNSRLS